MDADMHALSARLAEAEETLRPIRAGEIDAVVMQDPEGEQPSSLHNADCPYRKLIEQIRDGAAVLTAAGDVIYCNKGLARLMATPLQEIIGTAVLPHFEPYDREAVASLLAAGSGKKRVRLTSPGVGATDVLLSLTSSVIDGEVQLSLIVTDLTELHDAQQSRERAEQLSHAKDEFMVMLAHELRNPLSAISAALEVLRPASSNGGAAERARTIVARQTRHLSRLVDDLLEVARAITGKVTLAGAPLELGDAVRRSVAALGDRGEGSRSRSKAARIGYTATRCGSSRSSPT